MTGEAYLCGWPGYSNGPRLKVSAGEGLGGGMAEDRDMMSAEGILESDVCAELHCLPSCTLRGRAEGTSSLTAQAMDSLCLLSMVAICIAREPVCLA